MSRILIKLKLFVFLIFVSFTIRAQVLYVSAVIQEQDQWCWAAVSKCVLNYYGVNVSQCQIAEYTRLNASWHNFGPVNCCTNPHMGCNYWNYNYGATGSIQNILQHWNIQNNGVAYALNTNAVAQELANGRPFIVRWGWTAGGGHFVVGHGLVGNTFYYMNPWPGEGLMYTTYNNMVSSSVHTWTHTNVLTTSPQAIVSVLDYDIVKIFPNPVNDYIEFDKIDTFKGAVYCEIFNVAGSLLSKTEIHNNILDFSSFDNGVYFLRITSAEITFIKKVVKI